ncbi:MAG: DUF4363 family protein [Clostridia bacterium]|nr:DUF4363 family protein [Clostridia bacterium]
MKSFVVAIVLFACILAGSVVSTKHIDDVSKKMLEKNRSIAQMLEDNNFDGAKEGVGELEDYIHQKRSALSTTIDHTQVIAIELQLAELRQYINGEKKEDALAKNEALNTLFEHLPQNYELKLRNIL